MLSHHRRHSKKSSPPHQQRPGDTSIGTFDAIHLTPMKGSPSHGVNSDSGIMSTNSNAGGASSGGSGVFSVFARARRRWRTNQRDSDTLLPTTYASSTPAVKRVPFNPTVKNCNSFLMGGHYYPGKDKKRRYMRRRTLWYKIFCSSNLRKVASFFVVTYVLVWHILLPLGNLLIQVGLTLSHNNLGGNGDFHVQPHWLQHDLTLKIPDLQEEEKNSIEITAARSRLQFASPQRNRQRLSLLESIVPDWYNRNNHQPKTVIKNSVESDAEAGGTKQEARKDTVANRSQRENGQENSDQANTGKTNSLGGDQKEVLDSDANPQDVIDAITRGKKNHFDGKERVLTVNGDGLPVRTIHFSNDGTNMHSSCQLLDTSEFSTTMVTQTSLGRLWILNETCQRWTDPIVAVVFVPHGQEPAPGDVHLDCSNVQIIQYMADETESIAANYPVNRLRNVGLDAVTTSHVLVVDIDFVPATDLSQTIQKALVLRHEHHADVEDQQALIVPAFERLPPHPCDSEDDCATLLRSDSNFIPKTFPELQNCFKKKDCIVFQSKVNWEGHFSTRSDQWLQRQWYEDERETIFTSVPCFHTARYEPYVVVRWCPSSDASSSDPVAPYYDERFHGYGKNKIELVSHLRKSGYRFSILPQGFIVHNPHPESNIKETWNDINGSDLHASMDKLYSKFLTELDKKYEEIHDSTVKLCKRE